MTFLKN